ncbi:MAG: hypothetical protein COW34_04005 [Armatimonadetes bacterium CG17_big_fil_post_rev_8_21_14_2_50_66_6]|nr:MAG: hypothetical protein COW34_04005 [Armatimonadetes bacterium CG17_big_fil_post_rev_8_21_14_2_50_66_6]
MPHLLAIDVGTTGTKAALFDHTGRLAANAVSEYPLLTPRGSWVEQDAEDWWQAVVLTVRQVLAAGPRDVRALSLSTQGGAWAPLDTGGNALRPALSWMDKRADAIGRRLEAQKGAEWLYRLSGWSVGGGLPLLLTCWLREHEPEVFGQAAYFADTHAFVAHRLTGRLVTDHSNAAITQFYDLTNADWSPAACVFAGVDVDQLPALRRAGEPFGQLTPTAAAELGLPGETMVCVGGHDQYCAALGAGVTREGTCLLSCGTAWVALVDSPTLVFDPARKVSPGTHVIQDHWGLLTSVPVAGASFRWFRDRFRPGRPYEAVSAEAAAAPPGCGGLLFLPSNLRERPGSAFVDLDLSHDGAHLARAIMEGVAFAVRRNAEAISALGVATQGLTMIGGGARSDCWSQIVADVCQVPVTLPTQAEAACAGAAVLAGLGAGIFPEAQAAAESFTGIARLREPLAANAAVYTDQYGRFLQALT